MTSTTFSRATPTLQDRIASCAEEGPEAIEQRLNELDHEWTAGRMVKAALGLMILAGFALATVHDPRWLWLPVVAGALLLQYLFTCGGLLSHMFCYLGFRGGKSIDEERFALRALRGDFRDLPTMADVEDKDSIMRFEDEGGPALEHEETLYGPREAALLIISATH